MSLTRTCARMVSLAGLCTLVGCSPGHTTYTLTNSNYGDTLSIGVGDVTVLTLGTVGPGSYTDSVSISSPVLTYTPVSYSGPWTGAGLMEEYQFHATWPGSAHVVTPWQELGTIYPDRAFAFDVQVGSKPLPN